MAGDRQEMAERYEFKYEAQRIIDAIEPRAGAMMTLLCALQEAYNAGAQEAGASALAREQEMVEALKLLAECDLNDDNCASVEVACRRVRNIARAALDKAEIPHD